MPSNRRLKVAGFTIVLILFSLLYFSTSSHSSNREFYDRTVAGLEKKAAAAAHAAHLDTQKGATEDVQRPKKGAQDAEEELKERKPPQVVLGDGDRKGVSGGEKWDMGNEEGEGNGVAKNVEDEKTEEERVVEGTLNEILKKGPIIIFSKSYCPFSKKAKHIFSLYSLTPKPYIVELDEHKLGSKLQDALHKITGRRTVPNVLISGTSIGGGDDVEALHESGKLISRIKDLGGKRIMEAKLLDSKLRRGMGDDRR